MIPLKLAKKAKSVLGGPAVLRRPSNQQSRAENINEPRHSHQLFRLVIAYGSIVQKAVDITAVKTVDTAGA